MTILGIDFVPVNQFLSSFILILAFSLLVFIINYNRNSAIGRAFAVLLACMSFTYAGDVALFQVTSLVDAIPWLKFQWVGIAFIPAAYLHFSDALLRTTNDISNGRRIAVAAGYILGAIFLYLAIFTNLLVRDGFFFPAITQFRAGPLFGLFTVYFYAAVIWGVFNTQRARDRCLTSVTRRRMTFLMLSFAAPSFGVFPYMLVANQASTLPAWVLLSALFFVNIAITIMLVLMGYSVAFFDAFSPDRVVKYTLATYLLRGPLVATSVIGVIIAMPDDPIILGLPRDALLIPSIVSIIVLAQIAASYLKPLISNWVYHTEKDEVALLRYVDSRLLTTTDLRQALENVLTAICELMRVRTGFIANVAARSGPRLETSVGEAEAVERALSQFNVSILAGTDAGEDIFIPHQNIWYVPLKTHTGDVFLGLLGIEARSITPNLSDYESRMVQLLVNQAEFMLEDRRLQQSVFGALRDIAGEMERAQRVRSAVRYVGSPVENLIHAENNVVNEPDFPEMVRDALAHYWGGPKLTNSPLLQMEVVQQHATDTHGGDAVKALREILARAIENTKPNGERRMTASEWMLYNILELKFIQGMKVRDIARRLARSEADLYRKQKIAIEAVARALTDMEKSETPAEPSDE